MKQIVSYGGGTNSAAMVCELVRRGEFIDALVFSDTGGEKPETYAHVARMSAWLDERGYPGITVIRRKPALVGAGFADTLEAECLMRGQLPGIAYGFKSCSDKWKTQPFRTWLKEQAFGEEEVRVCVGFDSGEERRAARGDLHAEPYAKRYPLIEWQMEREDCVAAIAAAGITQPGKSSCFFCPSSKKAEVFALAKEHPLLFARAVDMERNANLSSISGLGRRFAWGALVAAAEDAQDLFPEPGIGMPCGCHDGEDDVTATPTTPIAPDARKD